MRRWNGWGVETTAYPLPQAAAAFLAERLGPGTPSADAALESVLACVPASRGPPHALLTTNPLDRLQHARGQSLPDWVALRSGRVGVFPDAVAYPASDEEVRSLLEFARANHIRLIPYGGGTSVVGHINPVADAVPTLTVDLSRLSKLLELDEVSRLATVEAGVRGPELEAQLQRLGFTLGHYPQSFEFSTLGGWIATRSTGQQSYFHGRIEDNFAGGRMETFLGRLDLAPLPASAAGPDLRQLVLGSEGRLGLITRAVTRVRRLPEVDAFFAAFFRTWQEGLDAVRHIVSLCKK